MHPPNYFQSFSLLILIPFILFSQQNHQSSSELTLLKKADEFMQKEQYDSAYIVSKRLFENSVEYGKDSIAIHAAILVASSLYKIKIEDSLDYLNIAEKIAKENSEIHYTIAVYYAQGKRYFDKENFELAMPLFLMIDSISERNNYIDINVIKSLIQRSQISRTTFTKASSEDAYNLLLQALNKAETIQSEEAINLTYVYLSDISGMIGKLDDAKKFIDLALEYYLQQDDITYVSRMYLINSSYYLAMDQIDNADQSHLDKIAYLRAKNSKLQLAEALMYYGNFQRRKLNNCEDALISLEESKALYEETSEKESNPYHRLLRDLGICNLELQNFKLAAIYYEQAYNLKMDLVAKANRELTINLETKYESRKKEQEIALLTAENQLNEQQQHNQRLIFISGLGLSSILVLLFYYMYKNRQKTALKLSQLDKAKSNFFANISHELRTPLTLISGPIQQQLKSETLSEEERHTLELANRNTKRLLNLVDQILDISKLESGSSRLMVSNEPIIPFIATLSEGFSYLAKQQHKTYNVELIPYHYDSWFDKDALEKMILNLLSNAFKYTSDGDTISCHAEVEDHVLHLNICNSGTHFAKGEINKLFDRFYQSNTNREGVGLGLALVKELVLLHNGSVNVSNNDDNVVNFSVKIPIDRSSYKEEEICNPDNKSGNQTIQIKSKFTKLHNKKIESPSDESSLVLIVDDNPEILVYLNSILIKDYQVIEAKNGKDGVSKAFKYIPDIIISDVMMPIKDGIWLCNQLKTDERTSHIPIILLTAKVGDINKIEGFKTGADDYIAKPFNLDLLLLKIEKLIENRKLLRDRYSQELVLKPYDISINSVDEMFFDRVQNIFDDRLIESSFSIDEFCKAVGMSRMQLHRKIKALTGLSTSEFIRSQRLKLAAQILQSSDQNISQIGYSVGFNDHAYFSKCFKESYGCTPSEYALKKA